MSEVAGSVRGRKGKEKAFALGKGEKEFMMIP